MKYLGGKYLIRNWLASEITKNSDPAAPLWEPFCGGLNASVAIGARLCSDSCEVLIATYRAIANGWDPPSSVTANEYYAAKALPESDPLHGFCRFALSFGGKSWGVRKKTKGNR